MFTCSVLDLQGARVIGHTYRGAVNLDGARIGGSLDCTFAELRNDSGSALLADGLQVDRNLSLDTTTAIGGARVRAWPLATRSTISLRNAQVGGQFQFLPKQLENPVEPHNLLTVDGLTYAGLPGRIWAPDWLKLLRHSTHYYAAQPYQQLAAACRAGGDERLAREILMAQRDDQLTVGATRNFGSRPERLWGWITKVTLGYGYQPWRALLFLFAVVAVSCVLAVALGAHGALAQTSKTATPGQSCTVLQQIAVGLDLNLPVGTSAARAACDLTTDSASATATWLSATAWVLRVLAWLFAALFIAGFTSAVRKT